MRRTTSFLRTESCLAAVLFFLCSASLRAENMIRIGHGMGAPGDTGIEVMVTATNDVPIHGYSIALTYPPQALDLLAISTVGTVNALGPEFVAPSLDNQLGIGVLGVILDFDDPHAAKTIDRLPEGAFPRIIARLVFSVKADAAGGVYPLELKDGIGSPASFNRFTDKGISLKPRLENGTFRVSGGNVLSVQRTMAFPGSSNLVIYAYAQHPEPLWGFQIGFTYDKSALELKSGTWSGTELGTALGGQNLIETFNFNINTEYSATRARATAASLFDAAPPLLGQTLSASPVHPQSLVKFTFNVKPNADQLAQYHDLILEDTFTPGQIDNRFIIVDRSVDPELNHGKVYFSTGTLTGRVVDTDTLKPVPGATVMLELEKTTVQTNSAGIFTFSGIPPGKYVLVLYAAGYYMSRADRKSDGSEILVRGSGATDSLGDIPIYKIPTGGMVRPFLRGYINSDNRLDLSDPIFMLSYLFGGGEMPRCLDAANVNDDRKVDLSDAIWELNFLFMGGPRPAQPFAQPKADCGYDTTGDSMGCEQFACP
jgi:hypothetical protein